MDFSLTFALLLYFNLFYFGVYVCLEFCLLCLKAYSLSYKYPTRTLVNEFFTLATIVALETYRLLLGQKHTKEDFDRELAAVFRILVLTVPSMYGVVYLTAWQTHVTRLDIAFGGIMLVIQGCQIISSFVLVTSRFMKDFRQRQRGRIK